MRRRDILQLAIAFVAERRDAGQIAREIESLGRDHNKVYDLLIKRSKYFNLQGDAVGCGWLRKLGEINGKIGEKFMELAEIFGGKI